MLIEFPRLRRPLPPRPFLKRAELRAVGTTTATVIVIVIAVVGRQWAFSSCPCPERSCGGSISVVLLKVIVIVLT
jgi:hypothetical protein